MKMDKICKIDEAGKLAEEKFRKWLDNHNVPYMYFQQSKDYFSKGLRKLFTKRPDFFLLIPGFGFILIDVKDKEPAKKFEKFFIDGKEVEKYINLQRALNINCWYVISNKRSHYKTWFWAPVTKLVRSDKGFMFKPKHKEEICYSVPLSEFIQVSFDDSLERVFSKLIRNY